MIKTAQKRKCIKLLSVAAITRLIKKELAVKFLDDIVWIKESNWERKGTILVYDLSIIRNVYYFIRKGFFEESATTASDKRGFSIFSHAPCPLYPDMEGVAKTGSKTKDRRRDGVSSIPHILKIIGRRKEENDIRFQQTRFAIV